MLELSNQDLADSRAFGGQDLWSQEEGSSPFAAVLEATLRLSLAVLADRSEACDGHLRMQTDSAWATRFGFLWSEMRLGRCESEPTDMIIFQEVEDWETSFDV